MTYPHAPRGQGLQIGARVMVWRGALPYDDQVVLVAPEPGDHWLVSHGRGLRGLEPEHSVYPACDLAVRLDVEQFDAAKVPPAPPRAMSPVDVAVARACKEPTLADALAWIALWECERVIPAARAFLNGETPRGPDGKGWDTCFKLLIERVLREWREPAPPIPDSAAWTPTNLQPSEWLTFRCVRDGRAFDLHTPRYGAPCASLFCGLTSIPNVPLRLGKDASDDARGRAACAWADVQIKERRL